MAYFRVRPWYKKSSYIDDDKIYGVTWDGSATNAWTRTDDAVGFTDPVPQMSDGNGGWTDGSSPFDNIMPWAGMEKVEDADAGTLVAIPKFYFKLDYANPSATVRGLKIQISRQQFTGSQISPAHMDRGDGAGERDVIYVGRYHCATSTYKSTTGVMPQNNTNRANFRTNIKNLGTGIWPWDYATLLTIQFLYLVEFANWDSQAKIGYGNGVSSIVNMGATDSMTYHTGTAQTDKTTYGAGVQYRNIEDLWANLYDIVDGHRIFNHQLFIMKNPADFKETSGGTNVGTLPSTSNWISAYTIPQVSGFTWAMYVSGVSSTEIFDKAMLNNTANAILVMGGYYYNRQREPGLFYLNQTQYSDAMSSFGCRIMKLP